MKVYSYVVEHDNGHAPNPYFEICTLCRCKFRNERENDQGRKKPRNIVELAGEGDWILGTGGSDRKKSSGHGNLVYAMRVDEKISREDYFKDPRFKKKKPAKKGTYEKTLGDNLPPRNEFEKREQFVLVSRHFYYFGSRPCDKNPVDISEFNLEQNARGFHYVNPAVFDRFRDWLEARYEPGIHGDPSNKAAAEGKGSTRCKSSCCG